MNYLVLKTLKTKFLDHSVNTNKSIGSNTKTNYLVLKTPKTAFSEHLDNIRRVFKLSVKLVLLKRLI